MSVRVRDRRGMFHSIEEEATEGRNEPSSELRQAEERLRTIEMVGRFREDKIRSEFQKLEDNLKK